MQMEEGFGGREGARTPDLLVAKDNLAVQDVHKALSVRQNAFSDRKLLRAFSLDDWASDFAILEIGPPRNALTESSK
jgi:hypothetical protein